MYHFENLPTHQGFPEYFPASENNQCLEGLLDIPFNPGPPKADGSVIQTTPPPPQMRSPSLPTAF